MNKTRLAGLLAVVALFVATVAHSGGSNAAPASFPDGQKGAVCGTVTITFSTGETVNGVIYPETSPAGKTILRIGIEGYNEKPWLAFYGTGEPESSHQLTALARKVCKP